MRPCALLMATLMAHLAVCEVHNLRHGKHTNDGANKRRLNGESTSDRMFIRYKSESGRAKVMERVKQVFAEYPDSKDMVVQISQSDADDLVKNYKDDIERIQVDSIWEEQGQFEHYVDRRLDEVTPYGINMIQADQVEIGPYPVQICIVDSGLDITHPDINADEAEGTNRVCHVDKEEMDWDVDVRRHGTHVAGIIAARIDNNIGVRGVGDIPVYIVRGLNDDGLALQSDILSAVKQCEDAGIKIITMSLGGDAMGDDMWELFDRLYDNGFLVFSATGNYNSPENFYPAAHPGVVAVTATERNKTLWSMSNYGSYVELACPGANIISTTPNDTYSSFSGTSMAAPHAAGAAALLWSHFPECSSHQIRYALAYTAEDLGKMGCDDKFGYGLVQVKDAYDFLSRHSCTDAKWGQTPSTGFCGTIDVDANTLKKASLANIATTSTTTTAAQKRSISSTLFDILMFRSNKSGT
jgi:serine protease